MFFIKTNLTQLKTKLLTIIILLSSQAYSQVLTSPTLPVKLTHSFSQETYNLNISWVSQRNEFAKNINGNIEFTSQLQVQSFLNAIKNTLISIENGSLNGFYEYNFRDDLYYSISYSNSNITLFDDYAEFIKLNVSECNTLVDEIEKVLSQSIE